MEPICRRVKLETGEVVAVAAWPAGSLKLTLAAMKRLEFSGISSEEFQKIQTDFADTEKISTIWPREFDSHGISVLDVETRLVFNASAVGTTAPAAGAQGDAPADDKFWWKVW